MVMLYIHKEETGSCNYFAKKYGVSPSLLRYRVNNLGMSMGEAIGGVKPIKCKNCNKLFIPCRIRGVRFCSTKCSKDLMNSKRSRSRIVKCTYCSKLFTTGERTKFCSEKCAKLYQPTRYRKYKESKPYRLCSFCGKSFKSMDSKAQCCSLQCAGKEMLKNRKVLVCPTCRKSFTLPHNAVLKGQRFCSVQCWSKAVESSSVGKEVIQKVGGSTDIMVKCRHHGRLRWVRKCRLVLEKMLGRKLAHGDLELIKFVDGNSLNCNPENLILVPAKISWSCILCKKVLVTRRNAFFRKTSDCCLPCSRKLAMKLNREQISCVLFLIRKEVVGEMLASWFRVSGSIISFIKHGKKPYTGVRPMAKKDVWKALLKQHDVLKKQATTTLYDRVSILAKVYKDPQFAIDMKADGKSYIEELDCRVSDTCMNFTELFQVLRLYPQKRQWTNGDLSSMRLVMLEKIREGNGKSKKTPKKKIVRKTATLTQVRDLEAENRRLKAEIKSANQIIKSLEAQLEAARATIGSLNETISLFRLDKKSSSRKKTVDV